MTQKPADYLLFREIVILKSQKLHLSEQGLQNVVNIRARLNWGLSPSLILAFPNTQPVSRPLVNSSIPDPYWIAGFTSGDGGFHIDVSKSSVYKLGVNAKLNFQIGQHDRDKNLMESLVTYLGCGHYMDKPGWGHYRVTQFSDNYDIIMPFFRKYPILGVKALDYADWCLVAEIMKRKEHLTKEGNDKILKIKAGLNKSRDWK